METLVSIDRPLIPFTSVDQFKELRSEIVGRRTYNRPKEGGKVETWVETCERVIRHQRKLWQDALGRPLETKEERELLELKRLLISKKAMLSGRTMWLGGTTKAYERSASQFNCAYISIRTVWDVVDAYWLLLQGCGVGATMEAGCLSGFVQTVKEIEVIRSTRKGRGGQRKNKELWDEDTKTWTLIVGDTSESWCRAAGKILAMKYPADKIVLDFRQVRAKGLRLEGYGWISGGDELIQKAFKKICELMSNAADRILTEFDIHDIFNLIATTLSSRRAAQIVLYPYDSPNWEIFASFKKDFWVKGNNHRRQSNNSLLFWRRPSIDELTNIFEIMKSSGGSEPGLVNAAAAKKRAPWFKGFNPCCEILLSHCGFCNLIEINVAAFSQETQEELERTIYILGRANYRQTCVDLVDGTLQEQWHLNNKHLRLCGVSITGIVERADLSANDLQKMRQLAHDSAISMAVELGLPTPKATTTVKPSGTAAKVLKCKEGAHEAAGKYILNNVVFSKHDPLVARMVAAGFRVFDDPEDVLNCLITMPICWETGHFEMVDGVEVDTETAIEQLDRYKFLMDNWADHNVSVTISYHPHEVVHIINWLYENWDSYVGVSFLPRQAVIGLAGADPETYLANPLLAGAKLGYQYLPQELVTKEIFEAYTSRLSQVDFSDLTEEEGLEISFGKECAGGVCPIR